MKNSVLKILSAILVFAFAAVSIAAQCSDADKKALEKMDKDWGDANQRRDKAAISAMLADGYSAFSLTGTTDKAAALANLDGPAPPANNNVANSDHYIVSCVGNTAVLTHRNEVIVDPDGDRNVFFSRSVHVFQKNGGKWQVIASVNHPVNDSGSLVYQTFSGLEAFKKKDIAWFERATDDSYLSVGPDGSVSNKSQVLESIKNTSENFEVLEIENINASTNGNTGVVLVTYYAKGKNADGTQFDGKMRVSRNFIRRGGKWYAIFSHSTRMGEN